MGKRFRTREYIRESADRERLYPIEPFPHRWMLWALPNIMRDVRDQIRYTEQRLRRRRRQLSPQALVLAQLEGRPVDKWYHEWLQDCADHDAKALVALRRVLAQLKELAHHA